MSIIYGLLTLLLSVMIPMLIAYVTDFQVIHFSLFFIVPVGAIAVGYLCSYGYFAGLKKSNKKITKSHSKIALLLAIVCLFSIYYLSFAWAHVDESGTIVYAFSGDHVSNYEAEGYGRLTFGTYTKYIIESTPISFSVKHRQLGSVNNPIVSWIFEGIDVIGLLLGSFLAASYVKDNNPYCDNCNKYKKKKEAFKIAKNNGEVFFSELNEAIADINTLTIKSIVNKYAKDDSEKEYYLGSIEYCDECKNTLLKFSLYELSKKNKVEQNSDYSYSVKVNHNLIRDYL